MSEPGGDTQAAVAAQLARLDELVQRLATARAALAPLEDGMAAAQREFDAAVGALRRRELTLTLELESLQVRDAPSIDPGGDDGGTIGPLPPPEPSAEVASDPDAFDKDVLLEHVVWVLDPMLDPDAAELVAELQQAVDDPGATLGDVLERLPPGPVWELCGPQESAADQLARLIRWQTALERRVEELQRLHESRENDPRHALWRQRERGEAVWRTFLEHAAEHHRLRNQELEVLLAELRAEEAEA